MPLPADYIERVYAGVLGKIIGVYLGRPIEGWTFESITRELGEIDYFVHERRGLPLLVTDDDISGTFTFLRSMPDNGCPRDLTAEQIGRTWLNYLIEKRTVLWWGGMGNSTEHTAFLRLKNGTPAPESGSIARNGKVVAEQIGAQIFIDGWGMIAPGDPEYAAELARRAASVSHDGEAIYGAQVVAAMEALAFVEQDIDRLIDTAVALIPRDSVVYTMICNIREWHSADSDWRRTRAKIAGRYGYDRYGGNCHIVPNHALVLHALLHGEGRFQRSLKIVNTCGWDTDCNSGNVGCLLGIRNGLAGIDEGPDWRGPIADRLFLPTADGGRCITDAVSETFRIVNIARALDGEPPLAPKDGARFHFTLPGSVQGWTAEESPEARGVCRVHNSSDFGAEVEPGLAIRFERLAAGRAVRVFASTFTPPEALKMGGYGIMASPTLYSGQQVRGRLLAHAANTGPVHCRLWIHVYGAGDSLETICGPSTLLEPGAEFPIEWTVPATHGRPIAKIGIEMTSERRVDGIVTLDFLTWDGVPNLEFCRLEGGSMWRKAWVNGVDALEGGSETEPYRLIQDEGTGLLIQGCREWRDYRVSAAVTPHLAQRAGIAACVQGMRRWYGLLLERDNALRLVKSLDTETVLAEVTCPWEFGERFDLALTVRGAYIRGEMAGELLFEVEDRDRPLMEGAIGLVVTEGRVKVESVRVEPAS